MGPPPGKLPPTGIAADGPFPREFGRYVLQELLGRGGMGAVYRAFDSVLRRDVALKMPHPELLQDAGLLARFYNEARAAARLWHPNLCPVFDVGEHQGLHYLTMQYVPGKALDPGPRAARSPSPPWSASSPWPWTRPTASASSAATSSRPTSSSPTTANRSSPTSAPPSASAPRTSV